MTVNRQWRLVKRPEGMIGEANFEFVETTVPKVVDRQILVKIFTFLLIPHSEAGQSTVPATSRLSA